MGIMMMEECPVVIVEDNARERELIANALTGYDLSHNVVALGSGAEVVHFLSSGARTSTRPCLVILDLDLQDMHGLDVLKIIRNDNNMSTVPVVIFSGSESALDAAVARELRADGFIVKPSSFHDLQATVRSLVVFWGSHARANMPPGTSSND